MNDFHGFAKPSKKSGSNECLGGIAYLAERLEQLRQGRRTLLLAAGDMIQGNNWANFSQGKSVIDLMNRMKFDAMVVGNHEFDFGQAALQQRICEAEFPLLGANVEGFSQLRPYIIKNINGIKIAIIGVVTEDAPHATHPRNVSGLKFLSPVDTAAKYLQALKGQADIFLILSHLGYAVEVALAEQVRGIDVIVGGHSHTKITVPGKIGNTIIVQASEHGKALGVLDLTLDRGKITAYKGWLEEIKPQTGKENQAVKAIVTKYQSDFDKIENRRVGETAVDLDGEGVRQKETNLGNLIADVIRQTAGADISLINGGSIRTSIPRGEIRAKDIYNVLPFDNYLAAIKLTGKQLVEALENGVSRVEEPGGRFPQVSGLRFSYARAALAGSRIKEVMVGDSPLQLDNEYIVATNDFIVAGGDGYKAFGEAIRASKDFTMVKGMLKGERLIYNDAGRWLRDVLMAYIEAQKSISPVVDGRIKEIN
jgi:2',3'-cyclic-nucleotide 2'-phosphodiesterase (5'-nucleotidase family)